MQVSMIRAHYCAPQADEDAFLSMQQEFWEAKKQQRADAERCKQCAPDSIILTNR